MSASMQRLIAPLILGLVAQVAVAVAEAPGPEAVVRQTSERMLAVLRERHAAIQAEPARLYGFVDDIVLPHFDFERMARWVLGKNWRKTTPEQQQRFVVEFRNLLVRTYGTALLEYNDQEVYFLPMRMSTDADDVTVRTELRRPAGGGIPINYSMYRRADGWKVYDVTIEGISLVSNYRATFAGEIRSAGIEGLIARLAERNIQGGK
ncbi:MAG: phospholipid-binding protein MlaC [Gammaproteobacteria bacterium]